jgi:hypothetical protein
MPWCQTAAKFGAPALTRFATSRAATVRAMTWSIESVREAELSPAEVFRFYADPETWGSWGHNTKWAKATGPLVEGGTVDVKAGYGRVYPVLIRRLQTDRFIECEVRPPGMTVVNGYEVVPAGAGVRLRHTIAVSGRFAGVAKLLQFDKLYTRLLEKETRRLVELALAARATGPGEGP